jgi:preprotein translocase subunit SecA
VLSAEHAAEEATVIAHAGRSGAVTVATPMAGRGADIALDDTARAAGGLAVVTLAMARSPRIDRQYIGRAGRQGDPGVAAPLASLDDEVLRRHRPALARLIAAIAGSGELRGVRRLLAAYTLRSAQRQSELAATRMRKRLLRADEDLDTALGFARPM